MVGKTENEAESTRAGTCGASAGCVVDWYRQKTKLHASRVVLVPKPGRRAVRDSELKRNANRSKRARVMRARARPDLGKQVAGLQKELAPLVERWGEYCLAAVIVRPEIKKLEQAIAREQAEAGNRRVELSQAARRVDLIALRDLLLRNVAATGALADEAVLELALLTREAERLQRKLGPLPGEGWVLPRRSAQPLTTEALAALLTTMERLYPCALAAGQRAEELRKQAAGMREQAAAITLQIGKKPGKKTRQERNALARQVGAAAA